MTGSGANAKRNRGHPEIDKGDEVKKKRTKRNTKGKVRNWRSTDTGSERTEKKLVQNDCFVKGIVYQSSLLCSQGLGRVNWFGHIGCQLSLLSCMEKRHYKKLPQTSFYIIFQAVDSSGKSI